MEEKIEIIYQMLMYDYVLSDKALLERGLNQTDIEILIASKVITPNSDGSYKLVSPNKFRQYGIKLLRERRGYEANLCFRKCYSLAPNGREICLQYMLALLKKPNPNYEKIFSIYANLEKLHPEKNAVNNNLYLFLLSIITEIPKEYDNKVRDLEYNDLMLSNHPGNIPENEIRSSIWKGKYTYAHSKLNELMRKSNNYSVKYDLLKELLSKTIDYERIFKRNLLDLAKNQRYEEIVSILSDRQQIKYLSTLETYILLVASAILELLETNIIPTSTINVTSDMEEALFGNNFKLAWKLNEEFIEYTNGNKEEDIVHILLDDLNKMILEIKEYRDPINVISQKNKLNITSSSLPIVEKQELDELTKEMIEAEGFVDYIVYENMTIEEAKKTLGLNLETVLMIKLAYVMNCYGYRISDENCYRKYSEPSEEKIKEANFILQEVEMYEDKSDKVVSFLNEVKSYDNKGNKKIKQIND